MFIIDCGDGCGTLWVDENPFFFKTLNGWLAWYVNYNCVIYMNYTALTKEGTRGYVRSTVICGHYLDSNSNKYTVKTK